MSLNALFAPSMIRDQSPARRSNPILEKLRSRLSCNDPSLASVSLCRLPVFDLSLEEVTSVLASMVHNRHVKDLELWIPSITEGSKDVDGDELMQDGSENDCEIVIDTDGDDDETVETSDGGHDTSAAYCYADLAAILTANTSVNSLSVVNAPSGEAWCALFQGMLEGPCAVQHLVLGEAALNTMPLDESACERLACCLLSRKADRSIGLRSLTLRGIHLCLEGARHLAAGLNGCGSLDRLELHQVEIRTDPTDPSSASSLLLGQFVVALARAPIGSLTVMECDLRLEGVDEDDDHPLTAFAASTTLIHSLRLLDCIDVDGVRPLALGLMANASTYLTVLDLRYNTLSVMSCEALDELLRRPDSPLQELVLEETSLEDECLTAMVSGLSANTSLRKLVLRGNSLSHRSCGLMQQALWNHPACQVLDISENSLDDFGAASLASLFRRNSALRDVTLEATGMTDAGVAAIFASLQHNHGIEVMRLSRNEVRLGAARALSSALSKNRQLNELDLTSCGVTDKALVEAIVPGLCGNRTLKRLCLAFNGIGNEGLCALGRVLPNVHVRSLDLQFNDFDAEGLESLVAGMSGNYLLHDVVVVNDGTYRSAQGFTTDPCHPSALLDRLSHYVKLNRAGRRAIPAAAGNTPSLRSVVLAKADASYGPSGVFHILRQQPHYISRHT
jgi:Leucine Rich repeat